MTRLLLAAVAAWAVFRVRLAWQRDSFNKFQRGFVDGMGRIGCVDE